MKEIKCVAGNPLKKNRNKVLVFTAKWCGACKRSVPEIVKKAEAAGLEVKLVDIDNADPIYRETLNRVHFVPHIDYMGHEIDEEQLENICSWKEAKEE